jgi:hypothetical protein
MGRASQARQNRDTDRHRGAAEFEPYASGDGPGLGRLGRMSDRAQAPERRSEDTSSKAEVRECAWRR